MATAIVPIQKNPEVPKLSLEVYNSEIEGNHITSEMTAWCYENIGFGWRITRRPTLQVYDPITDDVQLVRIRWMIDFVSEQDLLLFKLRWL